LLGDHSNAKFDAVKLNWVGSANTDTSVAVVHKRTGVKTWQDLKARTNDLIVGGTGIGTESVTVPYILRNLLGFKYRVIAGYPGGSEMNLAMLRGEVDGRGTFSWTSLKPHLKEWIESGELNILYQQGLRKHPDIPKIPLVMELTDDPEIKKVLTVQFTAFELGRPYFLPENVPADRVAAIRNAFNMAMKDKALLADADKLDQEINPYTGEEMQRVLGEVYATPRNLIERLANATKSKPDLKVLESSKKGEKK
jgi:tripartite-type tricarboxylate transporter receptor subunit TctC